MKRGSVIHDLPHQSKVNPFNVMLFVQLSLLYFLLLCYVFYDDILIPFHSLESPIGNISNDATRNWVGGHCSVEGRRYHVSGDGIFPHIWITFIKLRTRLHIRRQVNRLFVCMTCYKIFSWYRYYAVLQPLNLSKSRGKIMIVIAWAMAILCSAPQVRNNFKYYIHFSNLFKSVQFFNKTTVIPSTLTWNFPSHYILSSRHVGHSNPTKNYIQFITYCIMGFGMKLRKTKTPISKGRMPKCRKWAILILYFFFLLLIMLWTKRKILK